MELAIVLWTVSGKKTVINCDARTGVRTSFGSVLRNIATQYGYNIKDVALVPLNSSGNRPLTVRDAHIGVIEWVLEHLGSLDDVEFQIVVTSREEET